METETQVIVQVAEKRGAIERQAGEIMATAAALVVRDARGYEGAGAFLLMVKEYRRAVAELLDPIVEKAFAAHKEAVKQRNRLDAPADEAERTVKAKMIEWKEAEEARIREEARVAEEAARRKAEDERLAEAEAAEKAGDKLAAEALMDAPILTPPVMSMRTVPKIAGVAPRAVWTFEITNQALLSREHLMPDLIKIGGVVRAMKGLTKIPGVRVFQKSGMAV